MRERVRQSVFKVSPEEHQRRYDSKFLENSARRVETRRNVFRFTDRAYSKRPEITFATL